MKVKDFREVINGLEDPDAEIVVFFLERDEFQDKDGDLPDINIWNKVVKEFDYLSIDQVVIDQMQEMIYQFDKQDAET